MYYKDQIIRTKSKNFKKIKSLSEPLRVFKIFETKFFMEAFMWHFLNAPLIVTQAWYYLILSLKESLYDSSYISAQSTWVRINVLHINNRHSLSLYVEWKQLFRKFYTFITWFFPWGENRKLVFRLTLHKMVMVQTFCCHSIV